MPTLGIGYQNKWTSIYISMGLVIWIVLSALVFSKQVLDIIEVNTIPEKYVIHMINNELDNE